jgi:hypothetical protein
MAIGGKIKLEEGTAGGTHVGFKAPDIEVTSELLWELPAVDGSAGQMMVTDGALKLSWASVDVGTETTARMNADSSLQAAVLTETTARTVADSSLQAAVLVETTSRTVADSSLQAAILVETTARTMADSSLQAAILVLNEGTFDGTTVGLTAEQTVAIYYVKIGEQVTLFIPSGFSGTSNSTAFRITGLPASIIPARNQGYIPMASVDAGSDVVAYFEVRTNGIYGNKTVVGGSTSWTNSGAKGIYKGNMTYLLT